MHRGNLFLVGLTGAGKSTLGRQLARRLHKRFVDADAELEQRLGVSIPTIFEIEGEAGFRDREEAVIAELTALANIVLVDRRRRGAAPGESRAPEGERHGASTCTRAGDAVRRASATAATGRCSRRRIRSRASPSSMRQRDPLYREIADHVVESDRGEVMRFARMLEASGWQAPMTSA